MTHYSSANAMLYKNRQGRTQTGSGWTLFPENHVVDVSIDNLRSMFGDHCMLYYHKSLTFINEYADKGSLCIKTRSTGPSSLKMGDEWQTIISFAITCLFKGFEKDWTSPVIVGDWHPNIVHDSMGIKTEYYTTTRGEGLSLSEIVLDEISPLSVPEPPTFTTKAMAKSLDISEQLTMKSQLLTQPLPETMETPKGVLDGYLKGSTNPEDTDPVWRQMRESKKRWNFL